MDIDNRESRSREDFIEGNKRCASVKKEIVALSTGE